MFKHYSEPREFKIYMCCPNGNEFISFEKVESDFDLAITIQTIFNTEYSNVYEIQFVKDKTHEMGKWLIVKNGITIGHIEELNVTSL